MVRRRTREAIESTPLGREYARLNDFRNPDVSLREFTSERTYSAKELTLWSVEIEGVQHASLPPCGRSNPCIVGDLIVCSVCSPGQIVALNAKDGSTSWIRKLDSLGGDSVFFCRESNLIYGGTSRKLLALEPLTGETVWSFAPYRGKGEYIYSNPSICRDRLFIGDRRGMLHCLDSRTGSLRWSVKTSRAQNDDVNSTPCIAKNVVAVGTNANRAVGYDCQTGEKIWQCRLDGPCCTVSPGTNDTALYLTCHSVYRISTTDGKMVHHWHRRNWQVEDCCCVDDHVLFITEKYWRKDRPWPIGEIRAFRGEEQLYQISRPVFSNSHIIYDPTAKLVYEASFRGLGIIDASKGKRIAVINEFGGDLLMKFDMVSLPGFAQDRLYVLNDLGRLCALRHPLRG